jgi:hypothetical protein
MRHRKIVDAFRYVYRHAIGWRDRITRGRGNRLTAHIREERKSLRRHSLWQYARSTVVNAYFPSGGSVAAIALALGCVFAIIFYTDSITTQAPIAVLTRLTTIEAAIALIFIPITIFVVGLSSRRSSSGVTVAEILLRGIYLFPLTMLIMGIVVSFAFITNARLALLFIAVSFLLSGFCVFQTIKLLLDEESLSRAGIELLQDVVRRSINLALEERIGKNLELRALESLPLDYSPFGLGEDPATTYAIHASGQGFILDVSLDRLQEFATDLEKCANNSGFAYKEKRVPESVPAAQEPSIHEATSRQLKVDTSRYLKKLYADQITGDSDVLITFPQALAPKKGDRDRLTSIANRIFTIGPRESYLGRILRYLGEVKDQAILALRDRRTSSLESPLDAYVSVAKTFLEEMRMAGGGYTFEQALAEEAALLTRGWSEVKCISDHLAEIHDLACHSGDVRVAMLVTRVPLRIASAAVRARDHFLFREFTRFTFKLYEAALVEDSTKMHKYLLDRAWRHLSELGNFIVEPELRRNQTNAVVLQSLTDFGTTLLLRFQDLLKTALDAGQEADFKLFREGASSLFRYLSTPSSTFVESTPLGNANEKFQAQRGQMFFGLGSYIFDKHVADPTNANVLGCLNELFDHVPSTPSELTDLYLSLSDHKLQSIWGWEWWDAPEEASWVGDPMEKLNHYYCFLLARVCRSAPRDQVAAIRFPKSEVFTNAISDHGAIRATFNSFVADRSKWREVVPDSWIANVEVLVGIFEGLVTQNAREQEDSLIAAELDRNLLENFRNNFRHAFLGSAGIRSVFTRSEAYRDESSVAPKDKGELKWGLNIMEDKRFYVGVGSGLELDWGKRQGENLGSSECQFAFEEMLQLLPESEVGRGETPEEVVCRGIAELRGSRHVPSVIFMDLGFARQTSLENSPHFTAAWRLDAQFRQDPTFSGLFRFEDCEVPAHTVWGTNQKNRLCVLALPECMEWVQKSPIDNDSEVGLVDGQFSIRIADLAKEDELRAQILSRPPVWLIEKEDPERYLRTRVWLQIFERFQLALKQPAAGRKFIIPE